MRMTFWRASYTESINFRLATIYTFLTLVTYLLVYLFATSYTEHLTQSMAKQTSEGISKQVFNSMYQVMKMGWQRKDLLEFLKALEISYQDTPITINIYRSDAVKELYGTVPEPQKTNLHFLAFKGETQNKFEDGVYTYITPVKAESDCLRCHINAREGMILGVIETKINTQGFIMGLMDIFRNLLIISAVIFSVFFTFLVLSFRKVVNTLSEDISKNIENMKSLEDLGNLYSLADRTYSELKPVYESLRHLGEKLKSIAVDKEILEMEAHLLERFIITSKTINNWHEYIKTLMFEMNSIMPIDIIFSLFLEPDRLRIEIFLYKTPDEPTKNYIEAFIKTKVSLELPVSLLIDRQVFVNHYVINEGKFYGDEEKEKIKLRTKAVFFDKPQVGGIVGLGIESFVMEDATKQVIIDSLLSAMVNVIGSSKAISDYIEQIEFYAMRDPLTNLYNQRTFWELLSYELERARRFEGKLALLIFDLDNFKLVNDTHGHHIGDTLLREVAKTIGERKRKADIAARYGGDEFVVVAIGADALKAYTFASSLKEEIERITISLPDGDSLSPKVSVGIAVYPDHGDTPKDLFLIADSMLRNAKEEGKSNIRLPRQEDLVQTYREYSGKAIRILTAIDRGEVYPYYQKIVSIEAGHEFGYEVLMRIRENHIPANDFVEMAERLGVILKLDLMLYEKTFRKVREINYKGMLFFNLSPRSLISEDFIRSIESLTQNYSVEPERVVFELTERESIKNISLLESFIRKLKSKGFSFAIDDFGSGYSSFYYIKRLPVDFVKLEGEFVKNVKEDWRDRIFIESAVTLARGMGIKTIAEHVEDAEVFSMLGKLGVDYAQGYYIGKPSERLA